ncbi:MAG: bifunctional phosphoribosylaminoimidazolecarboxamide formyltransferase/IMP cyclohydrolase, partial [Sphingomonadales bacterium]|nr:bifunctional phosphoribosylaminoimidazolecarboxamide formyltransferase/IMP cyclohydrolase [Sphingomonadales bacterium]
MTENIKIKCALLSVSDKSGLADLGKQLVAMGVALISTGGTAKALREAGLEVADISDVTGFPEMMDGRVKTLHPKVHGGLLARRDDAGHVASMAEHDIAGIDLVIVNLYPFAQTVAKGAERGEIIENIDIGGPSMVRSAAKNHDFVTIVTDPSDYDALLTELQQSDGGTSLAFRKNMAAKAFAATASYDSMIAQWFGFADQGKMFPDTMPITMSRPVELRYGENPHQ